MSTGRKFYFRYLIKWSTKAMEYTLEEEKSTGTIYYVERTKHYKKHNLQM